MRRLVALVLLMLLPLQAIWAAAAPYCMHEDAPTALHLGHHAHAHPHERHPGASHVHGPSCAGGHGVAADQTPDQTADQAPDHADCHVCHAGGAPLPTVTLRLGAAPAHTGLASAPTADLPSPQPQRPERPKWPALA